MYGVELMWPGLCPEGARDRATPHGSSSVSTCGEGRSCRVMCSKYKACEQQYLFHSGCRSPEGGRAAIHQLFLSASANASNYLASTSRPLAEAALGLRGPGSRGVEGEPDGLRSLFSRL